MYTPGTVQLHHHSGKLFDAFCDFSVSHPEITWHQTADFFRFALDWPEAEPVLLIAVHDKKLLDPGATYWTDKKGSLPDGRSKEVTKERIIAGSMLAVMVRQPLRLRKRLFFFAQAWKIFYHLNHYCGRAFACNRHTAGKRVCAKGAFESIA